MPLPVARLKAEDLIQDTTPPKSDHKDEEDFNLDMEEGAETFAAKLDSD